MCAIPALWLNVGHVGARLIKMLLEGVFPLRSFFYTRARVTRNQPHCYVVTFHSAQLEHKSMKVYFFDTPNGYDHRFVWVMAPNDHRARLECLYLHGYRPLTSAAAVDWWNAYAAWEGLALRRDGNGLPLPDREVLKMSTSNWRRTRPPMIDGRRRRARK